MRGARALSDTAIRPDQRLDNSAGFGLQGSPGSEVGRLNAADGGPYEWALYGFAPPAGPLVQVEFHLQDDSAVDPAFVALANYSSGRWDISGPYSSSANSLAITRVLNNAVHLSPEPMPTAYFAILAPVGSDLSLQGISITTLENDPPTADLQADVAQGIAPLAVNFEAAASSDPDDSIVLYEFDFRDDGTYDASGPDSSAQHSYMLPGAFTARLRVTDADGATAETTLDVTVDAQANEPPVARLNLTPDEVNEGEMLTLGGALSSDSDGSIVLYEFDSDANGSFESSGTDSSIDITPPEAGRFPLRLRVTDNDGTTDVDTALLQVHGWNTHLVESENITGLDSSLAVVNGQPAISYQDSTNSSLRYVRAKGINGSKWNAAITVDSGGNTGLNSSLAVINGNPAISYWSLTDYTLRFARALDANGTTWGSPLELGQDLGQFSSLTEVNGRPAICYSADSVHELRYLRANDADGTNWGSSVLVDTVGSFLDCSMNVVNGKPAISYYDSLNQDLRYVRSSDAEGNSWLAPVIPDSTGSTGRSSSLEIVNGNPAIAYTFQASTRDMKFVRANDADGASWGLPLTLDSAGDTGVNPSLAVVGGTPSIAYADFTNFDLRFVRALDADGSTWDTPLTLDSADLVGWYVSLAVFNGSPAISYYDATNGDLRFAIGF
ncbi:PKD domain-containing protein [bacterium]|nr:PKD domain-containing protein [bacterium]